MRKKKKKKFKKLTKVGSFRCFEVFQKSFSIDYYPYEPVNMVKSNHSLLQSSDYSYITNVGHSVPIVFESFIYSYSDVEAPKW